MRLVVASNNVGKLEEIRAVLEHLSIVPVPVSDVVPEFDVEETGVTFLENARLKAEAAFAAAGEPCLADDSGLCVAGLGLEPGVRSSRYAGEGRTDAQRNLFLLQKMELLRGEQRAAYFACAVYAIVPVVLVSPAALCAVMGHYEGGVVGVAVEGRLHGRIGDSPAGGGGFGYDPLFYPRPDPSRSLAQFSLAEKNAISHRGQALSRFSSLLVSG
jgi:XTP/dITP diphosphohydrolase